METHQELKQVEGSDGHFLGSASVVDPALLVLSNDSKQLADWLLGLKQGDVQQTLSLLHSVISMLPTPPHEDGASVKRSRTEMEEPTPFVMPPIEGSDIVEDIFLNDEVDDAPLTAVILVPNDIGLISHVIGKQGASVQEIKRRTGARVQVERTNIVPVSAQDRNVFIITTTKSSTLALQLILKKIQEKQPAAAQSVKAVVPNDLVSKVIGKGGVTIKKLQADTGATMQVEKDLPTDHVPVGRTVFISGTPRQIASAHYQLMRNLVMDKDLPMEWRGGMPTPMNIMRPLLQPGMVPGAPNVPAHPGSHDPSRGGMFPSYPAVPSYGQIGPAAPHAMPHQAGGQQVTRFETTVPEYSVSYIIGKRGVFINDMQRTTSTNIEVAKSSDNGTDRRITVVGQPDGVQRAIKLLEEKVRDWQSRASNQFGGPPVAYPAQQHPNTGYPGAPPGQQPQVYQPQQQQPTYPYPAQYGPPQYTTPGQPPAAAPQPQYRNYGL